jgi:hypothetical protein
MRIPVLERERFIADTLYKKLWIHDFLPCPYRTWLSVFIPIVCIERGKFSRDSLIKCGDAFL